MFGMLTKNAMFINQMVFKLLLIERYLSSVVVFLFLFFID